VKSLGAVEKGLRQSSANSNVDIPLEREAMGRDMSDVYQISMQHMSVQAAIFIQSFLTRQYGSSDNCS